MPDYKDMYFKAMAKISDAVEILIAAQLAGEDAYTGDDCPVLFLPDSGEEAEDGQIERANRYFCRFALSAKKSRYISWITGRIMGLRFVIFHR